MDNGPNGNPPQNLQNTSSQLTMSQSYATAAQAQVQETESFNRKQAIILNAVEQLRNIDYVAHIGTLVGPNNIKAISRISKGRICIFLAKVELVEQVVRDHSITEINGYQINIRRLITPSRRIIMSNVCPSIPNDVLERAIIGNLGFTTTSPITYLKAGLGMDMYKHVISFRRQVYIKPDDNIDLPPSIIINNEGTEHRIFMSFDELICFACKQKGHIASRCPIPPVESPPTELIANDTNKQSLHAPLEPAPAHAPTNENTSQVCPEDTNEYVRMDDKFMEPEKTQDPRLTNKRPAISRNSSLTESPSDNSQDTEFLHPKDMPRTSLKFKTKKPKTDIPDETERQNEESLTNEDQRPISRSESVESLGAIEELLAPSKPLIEKLSPPLPLTFEQICDFFEKVHGNPDALSVAEKFTKDIEVFIDMLRRIHPIVSSRSIKSKCTRLRKKIGRQFYGDDYLSDSSQSSRISSF